MKKVNINNFICLFHSVLDTTLEVNNPEQKRINIKALESRYIKELAVLAKEIWTEHYTPIIGREQVDYMIGKFQSVPAIKEQLEQLVKYDLVWNQAELIGYMSYYNKKDHMFLSKFYLHKDFRGKGIGKLMMDYLIEKAKISASKSIQLTVNKFNSISINQYLRMGFKNIGPVVIDIGNGYIMDDYRLEFQITD
ncbi:MAG: GNAT family N-acetyltransferase [Bacteroidia bacterium]